MSRTANFYRNDRMEDTYYESIINLITAPLFSFLNFAQLFIAKTDGSSVLVGALLSQKKEDGKIHPVQFAS